MITFDGSNLSIDDIYRISLGSAEVRLCPESLAKVRASRERFQALAERNTPIYGVTTGFGEMVYLRVDARHETELQMNLIRSHCAGVGEPFSPAESRAIMAARLNTLMRGYSAVRAELVERLLWHLAQDLIAVVPQVGSLGASGDLAPLSHVAITLAGEGYVFDAQGHPRPTRERMEALGIRPLELKFKEGLALINGTSAMSGLGALVAHGAQRQVRIAEILSAFALEVLQASDSPFHPNGHDLARPHPGQIHSAGNIRALIQGSALIETDRQLQDRILQADARQEPVYLQKGYTLRCIPQILGAVRNALYHVRDTLTLELNSANDNPLFFEDGEIFHGGNFHGQPVAFAMDYLAIALTQLGVTSERRINRLLNRHLSGLTGFLVAGTPGLSSGLMGTQYPATALVAENRTICSPASIQSIPANGDNQDVVSMGLIAARNARRILANNQYILAVEALCVAQAADLSGRVQGLSPAARAVHGAIRERVAAVKEDRYMGDDLERMAELLRGDSLIRAAEGAGAGPLA